MMMTCKNPAVIDQQFQDGSAISVDVAEQAKAMWTAAHLVRRALGRDHTLALRVLRHLAQTATPTIARRAAAALSELVDAGRMVR